MKLVMAVLFGLCTLSTLFALLFGDDLDCENLEECLKDIDV